MSWLSNFLGLKKVKTPLVQQPEEIQSDFSQDGYLKDLATKNGYEKTIIAGMKKPKLSTKSLLG